MEYSDGAISPPIIGNAMLAMYRVDVNEGPINGNSQIRTLCRGKIPQAITYAVSGPIPAPPLYSEATIGKETNGPAGVNAPAPVAIMIPAIPEPSPIHLAIRWEGITTCISPAAVRPRII